VGGKGEESVRYVGEKPRQGLTLKRAGGRE